MRIWKETPISHTRKVEHVRYTSYIKSHPIPALDIATPRNTINKTGMKRLRS